MGRKPKSLSWAEAASVPLVGLTAWEGLVESLAIPVPSKDATESKSPDSILVIGGAGRPLCRIPPLFALFSCCPSAVTPLSFLLLLFPSLTELLLRHAGGVGSLVIQLAKHVLKLHVVATASRPESVEWCRSLGADLVIDHTKALLPQLKSHGLAGVKYVFNTADTVQYFDQVSDIVLPLGTYHNINATNGVPLDIGRLMSKRIAFTFGMMFARPLFNAAPEQQKKTLDTLATLLDNGVIKHVLTQQFPFTREGVVAALNQQKSGKTMGKIGVVIRHE